MSNMYKEILAENWKTGPMLAQWSRLKMYLSPSR